MGFYKNLCPGCMNEVGDAQECPYCGSTNLTKGYQMGDGMIYRDKAGAFGTVVEHTVCKDCASIIYSKVERPEILK